MELKAYRDKYAAVTAKGAEVVAISLDDVATLKRFRESIGAPFPFLSDPDGRVSRLYAGVSLRTGHQRLSATARPRAGGQHVKAEPRRHLSDRALMATWCAWSSASPSATGRS
jgi:hypothetical protein